MLCTHIHIPQKKSVYKQESAHLQVPEIAAQAAGLHHPGVRTSPLPSLPSLAFPVPVPLPLWPPQPLPQPALGNRHKDSMTKEQHRTTLRIYQLTGRKHISYPDLA